MWTKDSRFYAQGQPGATPVFLQVTRTSHVLYAMSLYGLYLGREEREEACHLMELVNG